MPDATPIGCLYVPDFPAWAARRGTRRTPGVVVVSRDRVVARDRAAARRGIEVGMRRGRVTVAFPEAAVVVRDPAVEAAAWEDLAQEVHEGTPFVEPEAPGVLFFRLLDAPALRALLRKHGLHAGLADDRETARLAALRAAPGTALHVPGGRRAAFLAGFPASLLVRAGFGEDLAERLALYGLGTLGMVARLTQKQLALQFGDEGVRLYRLLHPGQAARQRVRRFAPPPLVTARFDLDVGAAELYELAPIVEHLAHEVAAELGERLAGRLRLDLGAPGTPQHATAVRLLSAPTCEARPIVQTARTLLHAALRPGLDVTEVRFEAGALAEPPRRQLDLFTRPAVQEAIHRVGHRYPGALRRVVLRPHALFEEEAFSLVAALER